MNKFKFLSSAVMAAFFAFGLASCEKEDFKTDVNPEINAPTINIPGVDLPDSYKPGDAVVSIQPTVWAVINGEVKNVTALTTIKFNDVEMDSYTKTSSTGFAAMTVKIAATYEATVGEEKKTLSAEATIEVPALTPGQVAIFTPTLVMSAKSETGGDTPGGDTPGGDTPGGDTPGGDTPGDTEDESYVSLTNTVTEPVVKYHIDYANYLNYWFPAMTITSDKEFMLNGTYVTDINIINKNFATEANTEINKFNTAEKAPLVFENVTVYANSVTCIEFEAQTTKKYYTFIEGTVSRAAGDPIATFVVNETSYKITKYNTGLALPGSGHGHGHGSVGHNHGHGNAHDHGHGGSNAGGGIVSAL